MSSPNDRSQSLGSLLRQPYQALQNRLYQALPQQGFDNIRAAHSAVLRNIDAEGTRITVLAERAGMTKQSMGYLVDSLVTGGYLTLMQDPTDGRAKLAALTPRGTAAIQTLLEQSAACERLLAEQIGEDKLALLRELLGQVGEILQQ